MRIRFLKLAYGKNTEIIIVDVSLQINLYRTWRLSKILSWRVGKKQKKK